MSSDLDDFDWEASGRRDDAYEEAHKFNWRNTLENTKVRDRWCVDLKCYDGGGPAGRYVRHTMDFYWTREEARDEAKAQQLALGPGRKAEYRIRKVRIAVI